MERNDASKVSVKGWRRRIAGKLMVTSHEARQVSARLVFALCSTGGTRGATGCIQGTSGFPHQILQVPIQYTFGAQFKI